MALEPNTTYTATITLSSVGNDNRFLASVKFDPDLTHTGEGADVPESFRLIGYLLEHLLGQSSFDVDGIEQVLDDEDESIDTHEYNDTSSNVVSLRPKDIN